MMCMCTAPDKEYSKEGCHACWVCKQCGNFGGCDNVQALDWEEGVLKVHWLKQTGLRDGLGLPIEGDGVLKAHWLKQKPQKSKTLWGLLRELVSTRYWLWKYKRSAIRQGLPVVDAHKS